MLLFDIAFCGNQILLTATLNEMYTVAKLAYGSPAGLAHAPIYNGLGWRIDMDQSTGKVVSHNGGSPGISTFLLRNINSRQTVIVLENTDNMGPLAFGVNAMNILTTNLSGDSVRLQGNI